jgi:hypothetical protein
MRGALSISIVAIVACSARTSGSDRRADTASATARRTHSIVDTVAPLRSKTATSDSNPCKPRARLGIYSDLRIGPETGDLGGFEIFILPSSDTTFDALVQVAEGAPQQPVLVPARLDDSLVTFKMPETAGAMGTFKGYLSRCRLRGRFENDIEIDLPRRASFWQ